MIDQKHFSGRLNSDDSNDNILSPDVKMARNVVARGTVPNLRYESIKGNVIIPNNELPAGRNECIGSFYDGLKQRLIWFNWNSNSKHGIYQYSLIDKTVTSILICFTDSQTDILQFDLNYPIPSVNIVYTTDEDGDLLCWTDRNKRPKVLNILSAINNLYGSDWLEEYLDVSKAPPTTPIKCAYDNDNASEVNNLRKQLFIPKYRYVYGDNLNSVWSAWGRMPIPFNYTIPKIDTDPTKNCRIRCVVQTGGADVKKIEIAFAELGGTELTEGKQWSDFFSVVILDKAELSIHDNDVYIYDFYNNEAYPLVDQKESTLIFDYVPDKANTQELLNGNVIVYGGIVEGKDPVTPTATVTTSSEYPLTENTSTILSVTQGGLQGYGSGDIKFIVLGNVRKGDVYSTQVLVGATTYTITYTAVLNDTPALVLSGLSASATGQGFTQVSITSTTLVISRANQVLLKSNLLGVNQTITGTFDINNTTKVINYNNGAAAINLFFKGVQFWVGDDNNTIITVVNSVVSGADLLITFTGTVTTQLITDTLQFEPLLNSSIPSYSPSSKYNLGIVYFDEKGKTNGVITSVGYNAATSFFNTFINLNFLEYEIPYINLSVSHRPPLWAKYYSIVRTNNLSKSNYLYWMTDRTYKDDKYAYVSIESIQSYKKINPKSIIGYDFAQGDRIKFYVLFNANSTPGNVYGNTHDYEIYSQVINPTINGVVRNGQFLKIVLPETTAFFDFSNGISKAWCYYLVELYTPAKSVGDNANVYYEFGEKYDIINAGLATASHQGQIQNQSSDLVTPATFKLECGDAFFRKREINIGNILTYKLEPHILDSGFILPQTLTSEVFNNPDYVAVPAVAYQQLIGTGGFYNNAGWTINDTASSYTFRVTGTINVTSVTGVSTSFRIQIYVVDSASNVTQVVLWSAPTIFPLQTLTLSIDQTIVLPTNSKTFLHMASSNPNTKLSLVSGYLNYEEQATTFNVGVVDPNFSDFFISRINSNGRSFIINEDEKTIKYQTLLRWGLAYQQNTNINQINRFYGTNFDEVDRAKGEIQRFKTRDRILRVFQNRGCGQYGVYAKFIQSNQGIALTTTDEILTKSNINYYAGIFGLGDQYCGLISGKNQDYFKDPVRGYDVRLSNDGLEPISEKNKGQFYIQPLLPPYNKDYVRTTGGKAKILGAYDYFEEEAINVLQGGSIGGNSIQPYTFTWNEKRNSYCAFHDFTDCDWIASGEDNIFTWKNGQLYIHNNTEKYCNFYGVQHYPSVQVVFNDKTAIRKIFNSLSYQSNEKWTSAENGDILTSQFNQQTGLQQISQLKLPDYTQRGNYFDAALLRDANSLSNAQLALLEGDYLEGIWLQVKFTFIGDKFVFLYLPYINWEVNNRNF